MTRTHALTFAVMSIAIVIAASAIEAQADLAKRYTDQFNQLQSQLEAELPRTKDAAQASKLLAGDALDDKLVRYVVLKEATPAGLAAFAEQGAEHAALVDKLLGDTDLMKQMLIADGANGEKYGQAMLILSKIRKASSKSNAGVLQRLAVAIALEHAVPITQRNPKGAQNAPSHVDPVNRYLQYEKALLGGELDPAFEHLTTWDLRFVVDGNEPDETLVWGRQMLRNYRPDHIFNANYGWRYVAVVPSEVRYGSGDVKHDRDELQFFQNILMNGGVCGRRAFFGRFILRAYGIPTTARPSRGHAALAHWTPKGWVVNLGPSWGGGWTKTVYKKDKDFLASTQARANAEAYVMVKRAQWIGDVMGEQRTYGESAGEPAFWNGVSLKTQRRIIEESGAVELAALGEHLGESNQTVAEKVMAMQVAPEDKQITYADNGVITIPAAAYTGGGGKDVKTMKSFAGGMQIFLPRFSRQGITIMRGGAWRGGADSCRSGSRMPSSGYGRYNNWGFRAAMSPKPGQTDPHVTLDLGDGVTMEMVYIKRGKFIMGGTNTKDSKWHGVETPKHEVTLTRGYYMGKYEVTQAQFTKIMGRNPSKASKDPQAPADTISEGDAVDFCNKVSIKTGENVRLPTEAEWEYACRAGTTTKFFFGDDASKLDDYGWYDKNDGGSSHPVGQKKPNPWGLYDIVGNVCERVSDVYSKDYYAKGPKVDPTGPMQGTKSRFEYEVNVPGAGEYTLTARVVTANYDQRLNVTANGDDSITTMDLPFTLGSWKDSDPVVLNLKKGQNKLRFYRDAPPQYGVAVKSFTLTPVAR